LNPHADKKHHLRGGSFEIIFASAIFFTLPET
jgi:hypothetical protein